MKELGMITLGFTLLVWGLLSLANAMEKRECNFFEEITGKPTKYHSFDTCYIQQEGEWMRYDEYKARMTALEGLKD